MALPLLPPLGIGGDADAAIIEEEEEEVLLVDMVEEESKRLKPRLKGDREEDMLVRVWYETAESLQHNTYEHGWRKMLRRCRSDITDVETKDYIKHRPCGGVNRESTLHNRQLIFSYESLRLVTTSKYGTYRMCRKTGHTKSHFRQRVATTDVGCPRASPLKGKVHVLIHYKDFILVAALEGKTSFQPLTDVGANNGIALRGKEHVHHTTVL